jgi:hypothetical protein
MLGVGLCFLLGSGLYGQNVVTEWGTIAQAAINTPPIPPPMSYIRRAIVQLAVYDAAVAIEGGYRPYAASIQVNRPADLNAAVATAAYRAARPLATAAQAAALDAMYDAYIAALPAGEARSNGVLVGQSAAAAVQGLRADDGRYTQVLYQCATNPPGINQFEPENGCGNQPVGVNVGRIMPFTFADATQYRPSGPVPLTSLAYVRDFEETRDYGRSNGTVRTAEQTDIAYFWQVADIFRGITWLAVNRGLNVRDTARFFAMVYVASADAGIAGFHAKYYYQSWRPRAAIPQADADGNPDTAADSSWTPLLRVNHPEYPSGHSFISTAQADTVARFFGTSKLTWTLTASRAAIPQLVKVERTYTDLNVMLEEIYNSRVWAGLHWRHAMQHGADVGRRLAQNVCDNFFQPL